MAAIIFFSNAGWRIQIAVGLAYIILNLAYWAMALLTEPSEMWNMDERYVVERLEDHPNDNFTQVLWDAIQTTEKVGWVKKTQAAPATKNRKGWLAEAKENCRDKNWNCEAAGDKWRQMKLEKHDEE